MRGAGDRDLLVGEIDVLAHEQKRLERFRRRPDERDETRIASGLEDGAVPNLDGVDPVSRLDDASPLHGYADRVHRCIYA